MKPFTRRFEAAFYLVLFVAAFFALTSCSAKAPILPPLILPGIHHG